ncbi:hypothetical protein QBC40DRAFT_108988 [Triangularia verruculosa]|uniref:Zn(2)-C6 fungal-type domain-containing protein n=1 Tax=Triangularia verruculosa TaxID=2587418 RepID=A0AAN6XCP4_9PEZI|nr:hypothetical protein QBC40DRAFT_108988 [Triangularia verruculosa]
MDTHMDHIKTEEEESQGHGLPHPTPSQQRQTPAPRRQPSLTESSRGGRRTASSLTANRKVCDHCRTRRIKCDYQYPCQQCLNAALVCKRDQVPRKRGPKPGHGRVLDRIRSKEEEALGLVSRESSADFETAPASSLTTPQSTPPDTPFPTIPSDGQQSRSARQRYHHLIPLCVEVYTAHLYPLLPIIHLPTLQSYCCQPSVPPSQRTLLLALSALTSLHVASLPPPSKPPSASNTDWISAAKTFLEECLATRQAYDYVAHLQLNDAITSFLLSRLYIEMGNNRKAWFYLRETGTFAVELGLDREDGYAAVEGEDGLMRRRLFWALVIAEREFAILRNKPITSFKCKPQLPNFGYLHEDPNIHAGLVQLAEVYKPVNDDFVAAWNDTSSHHGEDGSAAVNSIKGAKLLELQRRLSHAAGAEQAPEATTDIQRIHLTITRQWLKLVTWQLSFRAHLLSFGNVNESMRFTYPLIIAHETLSFLHSLPPGRHHYHGRISTMEKIYEIGIWWLNVVGAVDNLDLVGRHNAKTDDDLLDAFVRVLSSSEQSRVLFAERLKMFAAAGGDQSDRLTCMVGKKFSQEVREQQGHREIKVEEQEVRVTQQQQQQQQQQHRGRYHRGAGPSLAVDTPSPAPTGPPTAPHTNETPPPPWFQGYSNSAITTPTSSGWASTSEVNSPEILFSPDIVSPGAGATSFGYFRFPGPKPGEGA